MNFCEMFNLSSAHVCRIERVKTGKSFISKLGQCVMVVLLYDEEYPVSFMPECKQVFFLMFLRKFSMYLAWHGFFVM